MKLFACIFSICLFFNGFSFFGALPESEGFVKDAISAQGDVIGVMSAASLPIEILKMLYGFEKDISTAAPKNKEKEEKKGTKGTVDFAVLTALQNSLKIEKAKLVEFSRGIGDIQMIFSMDEGVILREKVPIGVWAGVFLMMLYYLVALSRGNLPNAIICSSRKKKTRLN